MLVIEININQKMENMKMSLNTKLEVGLEIISAMIANASNEGYSIKDEKMKILLEERDKLYSGDEKTIDKIINPYPIDKKFESFGFYVININGNDTKEIEEALNKAKQIKGKPTAIIAKTIKGKGVSFMENSVGWHGKAPNEEEYKMALKELGGEADE